MSTYPTNNANFSFLPWMALRIVGILGATFAAELLVLVYIFAGWENATYLLSSRNKLLFWAVYLSFRLILGIFWFFVINLIVTGYPIKKPEVRRYPAGFLLFGILALPIGVVLAEMLVNGTIILMAILIPYY